MMLHKSLWLILAALFFGQVVFAQDTEPPTTRESAPDPALYEWTPIANGFDRPLYITNAGDGSNRLFVVEQSGHIWILQDGALNPEPFLDISGLIHGDVFGGGYTERGLLGLAFHPDYEQNGQFFIYYTAASSDNILARYQVSADNPNAADAASAVILMSVDDPYANHNGGQLAFGPDGYLYVAMGDGGSAGDPLGNGQNPATLLGKILRIDINAETYLVPEDNPFVEDVNFAPEIWAWGLRNPWRFSFDRATGDLYIADVGQNQREEINFQPADSTGGENYGWNIFEGSYRYSGGPEPANLVMPIAEYSHDAGCSVTGGYIYRGVALPEFEAVYLFGDYCSGNIWATYRDLRETWQTSVFMRTQFRVSSFGEDEAGELYVVDYQGVVYRLQASS
jgi:glucose/arabinose dehydrogenase